MALGILLLPAIGLGQVYPEVKIGNQIWMTKNLDVSTFRNGDPIPEAKTAEEWIAAGDNKQPAWCYYDNKPENGVVYGKLYNWYAVTDPRGIAAKGWHVPSGEEWKQLIDYLGPWDPYFGTTKISSKMRSDSLWYLFPGTNESGFNGLPGGRMKVEYNQCEFESITNSASWWSSTSYFESGKFCNIIGKMGVFIWGGASKADGMSVRCIKD